MHDSKNEDVPIMGRPRHSKRIRFRVLLNVARMIRNGNYGITYRAVVDYFNGIYPTRLIHESLRKLKKYYRKQKRKLMKKLRKTVAVKMKGVIAAQDGTHLGRFVTGESIEAQIVRDPASLLVKPFFLGLAAKASDIINLLNDQDELPLVWQTDNAKAYTCHEISIFLEQKKIIHLVSRPGTPTDNAVIERGMREIKRYTGLGKGMVIKQMKNTAVLLASCIHKINNTHKRPSRKNMTSIEYASTLKHWSKFVTREVFYESTKKLLAQRTKKGETLNERRTGERAVIYNQLKRFGLVTITRGGVLI